MKSSGRNSENICLPVYMPLAPGSGMAPSWPPSIARLANSCGVRRVSSFVSRYEPVIKSRRPPMIGPPYLGDMSWSCTRMSSMASARASSLCGTCRFISSPSKSAL